MTLEGLLTIAAVLSLVKSLQAAPGVALHPSCLLSSISSLLMSLLAVARQHGPGQAFARIVKP